VTLIDGELLYACDCGPGNALIDDWVSVHCGVSYDDGGKIAAKGRVNNHALTLLLSSTYFRQRGPKSLDRNAFSSEPVAELSAEDGAATLAAFTAAAITAEALRLPCAPKEWIVVGGGRLNGYLLSELRSRLPTPVRIAEDLGWAGDAIEAQAFGYLAVRSLLKLPLSWPSTTGVSEPVSGGVVWNPTLKMGMR
jgi:anhydro-N-acetylmuramic acid kinase